MLGFVLGHRSPKNLDHPNAESQQRHRDLVTRESRTRMVEKGPPGGREMCPREWMGTLHFLNQGKVCVSSSSRK